MFSRIELANRIDQKIGIRDIQFPTPMGEKAQNFYAFTVRNKVFQDFFTGRNNQVEQIFRLLQRIQDSDVVQDFK